ncbi:MAG: acetyl-CoA carboxylase biotin carboxylase subunit [bacterium]|nr:acetyl-CoA carboxylase biotin carboxylase subunit [bacterium]
MSQKITKILIANRGEIAVRIVRACRDMKIKSVAVFSEADSTAYHVRMADEAYCVGAAPSSESYLRQEKIIEVAKEAGAEAVHPGYGFLAENAEFAQKCQASGLIFIGPKPETITLLGDKIQSRRTAIDCSLPVVPGAEIDATDLADAVQKAEEIGFPVLIKATAGGGGKGMRMVPSPDEFKSALERASSEAMSAFGDGRVFVEKFLTRPRHIEIQILCDSHGHTIHLGERECSIQRRHQKLIEETPSPVVTPELRQRMGDAAINIARATEYVGAGTVEFMYNDESGEFYFLEVNTRLQVEHPVTEMVTGIDLVKEQIKIAGGEELAYTQDDIQSSGHAIECRITAEDSEQGFMPSTGTLRNYRIPAGPGVRVDSGVVIFSEVPIYYDPLIAKLVVWGKDREEAISRTRRALEEYRVSGVSTTIGFHRVVMENRRFTDGDLSTNFLTEEYPESKFQVVDEDLKEKAAIAAALDKLVRDRRITTINVKSGSGGSNWSNYHRRGNLKKFGGSR